MNAHSEFRKFTRRHLGRLERNLDLAAGTGDVDAVHDLRVASRRLREPLEIMGTWLPDKKIRPVQESLGVLRRCFRDVRDLDVLITSLADNREGPPLTPEVLAQLEGVTTSLRARCLDDARRRLARLESARTLRKIRAFARTFEKMAAGDDDEIRARARKMWRRRAKKLLRRSPVAGAPADLHDCRIKLKALRYCTELTCALDGQPAGALGRRFADMQDRLGAWNDHLYAARMLSRMVTRRKRMACASGRSAAVLTYAARRAALAEAARREALLHWPALEADVKAALAHPANAAPVIGPGVPVDTPPTLRIPQQRQSNERVQ